MEHLEFFKKNQYCYIPNLVSKDVASFLYNYLVIKACTDHDFADGEGLDKNYINYCYCDLCSETLLGFLVDPLSQVTGKKLFPTYSYTRLYMSGEILAPHRDRASCEYSVTINFGGDPWPIYFGKINKDTMENGYSLAAEITMNPGDGIIYMGEELVHWRNKFEGDHCAQAFLHYIDENGPHYPEWKYDKRVNIGYKRK